MSFTYQAVDRPLINLAKNCAPILESLQLQPWEFSPKSAYYLTRRGARIPAFLLKMASGILSLNAYQAAR